jgi:3-methyladenine DNA glycosylase Tag
VSSIQAIKKRAADRKGGESVIAGLMPKIISSTELAAIGDDRVLAEMTKRVFCSGFNWSVIEKKWPGFEAAFLGFDPIELLHQPPDFWDARASDTRIVRNGQKIMSVAGNAQFIAEISSEHGSFGKFLAAWPADDQVGLLEILGKRGSRLGGKTGQYFLRFIGKDVFMLSQDVITCLRDSGLEIAENPTSRRDMGKIQQQFNQWHQETKLPYTHLSRLCAMSIGENYPAAQLQAYMDE